MFVECIEKVLPCLSNSWKLRIIAHLNSPPNLKELSEALNACYSESLGVVIVRFGSREVNFFASGKVTIREVNDVEEGKKLVNSILALAAQKQILKEQQVMVMEYP
jgi:ArsR family metal-binding transcriptional regulator